jgi:hypothetical protein
MGPGFLTLRTLDRLLTYLCPIVRLWWLPLDSDTFSSSVLDRLHPRAIARMPLRGSDARSGSLTLLNRAAFVRKVRSLVQPQHRSDGLEDIRSDAGWRQSLTGRYDELIGLCLTRHRDCQLLCVQQECFWTFQTRIT